MLNVSTRTFISSLNSGDLRWDLAPPGATGFFVGDQLGGSGWEVELPDGSKEKYYTEVPGNVTVSQHFSDISADQFPELQGLTIEEAAKLYIDEMAALLERARNRFLPGVARPKTHLRLVKG